LFLNLRTGRQDLDIQEYLRKKNERLARNRGNAAAGAREREFFIDNLLFRIHFTIVMSRWTGLAPQVPLFFFIALTPRVE